MQGSTKSAERTSPAGLCKCMVSHDLVSLGNSADSSVRPAQGTTVSASQEPDTQHFISALQKIEGSAGRYSPGSVLMAQDPTDLNRCNFQPARQTITWLDGYPSFGSWMRGAGCIC